MYQDSSIIHNVSINENEYNKHKRLLVFDTETTGLKNSKEYILQLCFIVYDIPKKEIIRTYNSYIKIPPNIEIKEEITKINGITREICDEKGVPIEDALLEFAHEYLCSDIIVAHNLDFDKYFIELEISRNLYKLVDNSPYIAGLFSNILCNSFKIKHECSMKLSCKIVNIMTPLKDGKPRKTPKYPSLLELYQYLFGTIPEGRLHDALTDTLVCLKCYLKISNIE